MLYTAVIIAVICILTLFWVTALLNVYKRTDAKTLHTLQQDLEREKTWNKHFKRTIQHQQQKEQHTNKQFLQIRLELLNTEDDLKEVVSQLLN